MLFRSPTYYRHGYTPQVAKLLGDPAAIRWIESYAPTSTPQDPSGLGDVEGIVFAADVWKSVKRHWVLELQRLIRARRAASHER